MRKHGLKSASKKAKALAAAEDEADETLDFLDSRTMLGEQAVRGGDLAVRLKGRQTKEERMASVMEGVCPPVPLVHLTSATECGHAERCACVLFGI